MTRLSLFEIIKIELKGDLKDIYITIEKYISDLNKCEYTLSDDQQVKISYLIRKKMKQRWDSSNRTEVYFKKKYHDWLLKSVDFYNAEATTSKQLITGRPSTSFADSSDRSKRRKQKIYDHQYLQRN